MNSPDSESGRKQLDQHNNFRWAMIGDSLCYHLPDKQNYCRCVFHYVNYSRALDGVTDLVFAESVCASPRSQPTLQGRFQGTPVFRVLIWVYPRLKRDILDCSSNSAPRLLLP